MNDKWKTEKIEPNKLLLHEPLLRMIDRLRRELLNVNNLRAPCDEYVSRGLIAMAVKEADELLATFPRSSQNQTVSSGVEGAHEGTTADEKAELPREHQCVSANDCPLCDEYVPPKSGSREPEKLNNAPDPLDYFLVTYGFDGNNHARQMLISCWAAARQYERKQAAESSLSSPRD